MRAVTIYVLAAGVVFGACERGTSADANTRPAAGAPSSALASPGTAAPAAANPAPPTGAPAAAGTSGPATGTTAAAAVGAPAAASAAPAVHEVTLPAGTRLQVVLDTSVGSDTSRVEQPVHAHLSHPVIVHGETILPEGAGVNGVVTSAVRSGKVKGRAHVAVRFDSLTPRGNDERYRIRTASVERTARATKKKDAVKIGGGAAGGAVIGAIVGGKKGAAIGTAVGGGAGTAAVLSTRGDEVHLPKGSALTLRLSEPLTIRIRG